MEKTRVTPTAARAPASLPNRRPNAECHASWLPNRPGNLVTRPREWSATVEDTVLGSPSPDAGVVL